MRASSPTVSAVRRVRAGGPGNGRRDEAPDDAFEVREDHRFVLVLQAGGRDKPRLQRDPAEIEGHDGRDGHARVDIATRRSLARASPGKLDEEFGGREAAYGRVEGQAVQGGVRDEPE